MLLQSCRAEDGLSALQVAFAVVTYATADTYPTPILNKTYFGNPQPIMKALSQTPHEFGMGQTGSGGGRGMAALEGIAAALEVSRCFRKNMWH